MSYNHLSQARECLWCEASIEGRADKQFCSSSCKAHYNRENSKQPFIEPSRPAGPAARLTAKPPSLIVRPQPVPDDESEEDEEDDNEDWTTKYQREVQERRDQEKTKDLHSLYMELADEFLRDEGNAYDWEPLDDFITELDTAVGKYRHHPGLRSSIHPAHSRLADLYLMSEYLRDLRKAMEEAEDEATPFFGKSEIVCLKLSKKHRKRLRANLLGEE